MALVQANLKSQLLSLFNSMKNTQMSETDYADQLATIFTNYIKTAQVNAGIPVSTTGSAAAQTGATTGLGSIS